MLDESIQTRPEPTSSGAALRKSAFGELWTLTPLLRRHAWAAPTALLLGLGSAIAESVGVSLVILFLYLILGRGADAVAAGGVLGQIFEVVNRVVGGGSVALGVLIFALMMGKAALNLAYGFIITTVRNRISEDVRNLVQAQCLEMSYDDVRQHEAGGLLNVLATESWSVAEAWHAAVRIGINLGSVCVFGVLLLAVSWQMTLIAAAGSALLALALRALSLRAESLSGAAVDANRQLAARMLTILRAMRTIRAFGLEAAEKLQFREVSSEVRHRFGRLERLYTLVGPLGEIGSLALLGAIVTASIPLGIPSAAVLAVVALLHRMNPHIRELEGHRIKLAGSVASVRAVRTLLDRSDKTYPPEGELAFTRLRRGIAFDDVTFTHRDSAAPSLTKASFVLGQGVLTAVLGPSGSGKTTIVNLLLRLYEPQSGAILVDGVPLQRIARGEWLSRVALAGQDTELVEGTVAENIHMARPGASLENLRAAAAEAGILDFIDTLPDGFGSRVGEGGLNLSGGQRQRIGLARALVREPELLILDEATNALDGKLEDDIRVGLVARLPRTTIVIITHRVDTVLTADHVICVSDGRIVEAGAPGNLLSLKDGVFRRMLERQAA